MGVRIKDIAQTAGVSPATVSLVLNNRPGVGDDTRQRILELARTLEYDLERSNNLTQGKEETLRFLRVSRHGHVVNDDHAVFIANYIDGMGAEALELGLKLEVLTLRDGPIESVVEAAAAGGAAGCVILGTEMSREELAAFRGLRTPFVFMDTYDEVLAYDFVDMNNAESVNAAIDLFASRGHRDIGLVTSDVQTPNFRMRAAAFKEALARRGLPWRKEWSFVVDSTFAGAYAGMAAALSSSSPLPDALFCCNDIMAFGCIKALKEKGLRVPEDVSVIGFDNLPASSMFDPPLTTIEVSKQQIGRLAVRALYDRMTARSPQPAVKILVSGSIVERGSVKSAR